MLKGQADWVDEELTAHIGIVEVDAPVASSAGGNEAVPWLNTDRTAGNTYTLGWPKRDSKTISTYYFEKKDVGIQGL